MLIENTGTKGRDNALVESPADLFQNFAAGNFALKAASRACNRGTGSVALLPSVDLAGNSRVYGKAIDIGCYECQSEPGLVFTFR